MADRKSPPRYTYPVGEEGDALEPFQCVTFFLPAGWWNKAAFAGAFFQMGYRFMWPDTEYGRSVADAWRLAYEMSREDDYMAHITVNVENTQSCGGCGSGQSGELQPIPYEIDQTTTIDGPEPAQTGEYVESETATSPPPAYVDEYPTWEAFNEQKCRAANWYADKILIAINNIKNSLEATAGELVFAIITGIILAFADGPLPAGEAFLISVLVVPPVVQWFRDSSADRSELINWVLELTKCEIVEIIYDAASEVELGTTLQEYLNNAADNANLSDNGRLVAKALIKMHFSFGLANFIFQNLDALVPDDHPIECQCGVQPPSYLWDFEDGTLQGAVFVPNDPYPSSSNLGQLANDAITGNHSIDINISDQRDAGVFDGSSWEFTIDPKVVLSVGDTISFNYRYEGTGDVQIATTLLLFGLPAALVGTQNSASWNGTYTYTVDAAQAGNQIEGFRIRMLAESLENGYVGDRFVVDDVSVMLANA